MGTQLVFWIVLFALLVCVLIFDKKYSMLRDTSTAISKPYSFARVQLAWWSVIILASFVTITYSKGIPTFDVSTLILLGISSATTATARVIDLSDQADSTITRVQDQNGQNVVLDILSDEKGVSMHRFQTVVFNVTFGIWFIHEVLNNLPATTAATVSSVMPVISQNNLILLGLSSGAYAALKSTENRSTHQRQGQPDIQSEFVPDEALHGGVKGEG